MADSSFHRQKRRRTRSSSPARHQSHRQRSADDSHRRSTKSTSTPIALPYGSRQLSKHDYKVFRPMFASYLDIQKGKYLEDMDEIEAKGRWKSFIGKWNRGELADGWYDPSTLQKAIAASVEDENVSRDGISHSAQSSRSRPRREERDEHSEDSGSEDSVGPALPGQDEQRSRGRAGPSIPSIQDLELRREKAHEDHLSTRTDTQHARKAHRKTRTAQLDDLAPKADAGTHERRLEKKADLNAKLSSFREKSPGAEVPDSEMMGGGDGVDDFKRVKKEEERKKTEREIRREEIARAKAAEREERLGSYRIKEEGTMAFLRGLAKERFG